MGDYIQAIAQNGKLHSIFGATSLEPIYSEGLPSKSLICPDSYYDRRLDTDVIVPLRETSHVFTETGCGGGGANGNIDPGETVSLAATLLNYVSNATVGAATITGISATLSTTTPGVTITTPTATWANLAPLAASTGSAPFAFQVSPSFVAGTAIDFTLAVRSDQGTTELPIRAFTGTPAVGTALIDESFESAVVPALPAGWTAVVGGGTADPWVTSSTFAPMTTKFAFHANSGQGPKWMRLFSPTVTVRASPDKRT